jgi:hypothetical protein
VRSKAVLVDCKVSVVKPIHSPETNEAANLLPDSATD